VSGHFSPQPVFFQNWRKIHYVSKAASLALHVGFIRAIAIDRNTHKGMALRAMQMLNAKKYFA
jgi:hypothetical protein